MLPVVPGILGELRLSSHAGPAGTGLVKALYWCLAERTEVGVVIDLYSAA